jgi:hypothetical protein
MKKTKAERREGTKKRRAKRYKVHSKELGTIYSEAWRKRATQSTQQ